jgi:hypothetical protein
MLDLALDNDFSVYLNDRNDVSTVTEREEFEQSVAIFLTDYLYDSVLGDIDRETANQKVRLQVHRVARDHDRLNEIERVVVTPSESSPNTLNVRIAYTSDEIFEVNVSE